ncbi:beta-1,6-N-acetylglucosaminyltransferase [Mucilaginibacter terrae]|uniref:beta-1,6-N-acetylglucosaminyltransferase n=1 Tax=Mucilaginibacter terrae TaxID=1955052 RepID=UPI00363F36E8
MKNAILIVAFRDVNHIIDIISCFDENDFIFFIHINNKSTVTKQEVDKLNNITNVIFAGQLFNTYWGSVNHLRSILYLSELALKHDVDYIHLISGQDYPVKSSHDIKNFLIENKGKQYLEYIDVPNDLWKDEDGGLSRLNYYHLNDYISGNKKSGRGILKGLLILQKALGIKRGFNKDFPKIYGGSTWWSLTAPCLKFVIDYLKTNDKFWKRFNNTLVSEEFLFQTIILNSPFKDSVVNNNLRYISWNKKHGSRPAILDEEDMDALYKADYLFARKIVSPISNNLKAELNSKIVSKTV